MIVIDQPHDLSADDEAALVAYVDGNLDPDERGRVEARAAEDPVVRRGAGPPAAGRDAIVTASESAGAPLALRARVEGMAAPGRRHGDRRPSARTRLGGIRWPGAGLVAGAVAAVLAAIVLVGGGPGRRGRRRRRRAAADRAGRRRPAHVEAAGREDRRRQLPQLRGQVRLEGGGHPHGRDRRARHADGLLREGRQADRLYRGRRRRPVEARRRRQGHPRGHRAAVADTPTGGRSSPGSATARPACSPSSRAMSRATSCSSWPAGRARAPSTSRRSATPRRSRGSPA